MKRAAWPVTVIGYVLFLTHSANGGYLLETDRPDYSIYEMGDRPALVVRVKEAAGAQQMPPLAVYDHLDRKVVDLKTPTDLRDGTKIEFTPDRLGYFEVRAQGSGAEALIPASGSRGAGRLPFAVVNKRDPNPSRDFQQSFLALQGTTSIDRQQAVGYVGLALHGYLGIQSVGLNYGWGMMEPTGVAGELERNLAQDKQPAAIATTKMVPYFHLSSIPRWTFDVERLPEKERADTKKSTRLPPKDWGKYEEYLRKIVPYIAEKYAAVPQRVYEIAWEPCIPWGWYGTPEELAKLHEVSARVIHECDPKGLVAGPTLASLTDTALLKTYLRAGVGRYLDVMTLHPYSIYPPEKAGIPEGIDTMRRITREALGRELDLYGTEFGYQTQPPLTDLTRAYGTIAGLLIFKGEGFRKHAAFYLGDYAGEPGYGLMYNLEKKLNFGPARVAPKVDVPLIRAAADLVSRASVVGKMDYLAADVWAYVFRGEDGKLLAAIWDASGQDRTISFDCGTANVETMDCFGNPMNVQTKEGKIELPLSRLPVYVRGISEELYGGASEALLKNEQVWEVYRGEKVKRKISLNSDLMANAKTFAFTAQPDVWSGKFEKKLRGQSEVDLEWQVSPRAPLGPTAGRVIVRDDNGGVHRALLRIIIKPELEMGAIRTVLREGQWSVEQTIRNLSQQDWRGEYTLAVSDEAPSRKNLSIKAGKSATIWVPMNAQHHPALPLNATAKCISKEGAELTRQDSLSLFVIPRTKEHGTQMWEQMTGFDLPRNATTLTNLHPEIPVGGADDLSAHVATAHDAENLYVQVKVRDNVHRNDAPPMRTWDQDSLQVAVDVLPDRSISGNTFAVESERTDSEFCAAFTTRGPEIYLSAVPAGSKLKINALADSPGFKLEGGPRDEACVYRLTIPWTFLDPRHVRNGKTIALTLLINDSDKDVPNGDRKMLRLFAGIHGGKDVRLYGRAMLGE